MDGSLETMEQQALNGNEDYDSSGDEVVTTKFLNGLPETCKNNAEIPQGKIDDLAKLPELNSKKTDTDIDTLAQDLNTIDIGLNAIVDQLTTSENEYNEATLLCGDDVDATSDSFTTAKMITDGFGSVISDDADEITEIVQENDGDITCGAHKKGDEEISEQSQNLDVPTHIDLNTNGSRNSSDENISIESHLSDNSISDNEASVPKDPDSFVISFPGGDSYDLTDQNCHTAVIQSVSSLIKKLTKAEEVKIKNGTNLLEKDKQIAAMKNHISEMDEKNKKLDSKILELIRALEKSKELLKSHDASARTAISRMQKDNDDQIKHLKGKCSAMQKEKETAVMNFARREKELLDAKRLAEGADKKVRETLRERDKAIAQMKGMKLDLAKIKSTTEKKDTEVVQFKKDIEKWKEEANSHVIKVKWAQNKLKSETDLHHETKEKLARALTEIQRAKEEAEQVRKNCQGMIKTYQESEEMRSNSLDSKLKEKEMLLSQQEAKSGELEGIQKQQLDELRRLKQKHKDALEENGVLKTRVECLEKERMKNEDTLKSYTEVLNRQKKEATSFSEQLKELDEVKGELELKNQELKKLEETLIARQESEKQMKSDEENWKTKEQELLEFTQRVSSKNAQLTSETENLTSRLEETRKELTKSQTSSSKLEKELKSLKSELTAQTKSASNLSSELSKRLEDKETTVNQLTLQLDELKDEVRTIKRKNNANIKDLTRQLQQTRKRLEPYESSSFPATSGPNTEDGSMGSRASSDTSLECVGRTPNTNNSSILSHNSAAESGTLSSNSNGNAEVPETMVTTTGEISTQTLIERIVRLQRIHARKNEKIDFLHDHIQQLVDEMQKKNKIIQHYILREESGMLMSDTGLGYGVTPDNSKMSRHLSMEINRKMQSVLEDTLLKNIALKESIDALGKEIARLSVSKT